MAVKTFHLTDGRKFKLGRNTPVVHYPSLKFSNYLKGVTLPTPPVPTDYTEKAATALAQMYLNDQLGDCVVAGCEHVEGVLTGNANPPPILYTDTQTKSTYSGACGYVDGNSSTDQGCEVQAVLSYWQTKGLPAGSNHKIVGYLAVDATNITECQTALWLFENLIFGVGLPDAWVNPMPESANFVWDVAGNADPNNGHCFAAFGFDAAKFTISTWGMLGYITNGAVSKYATSSAGGELYVVISEEQLNNATQKAPNGLDWTSLVEDFNALGGKLVVPPGPTPNTSPNPGPTQPLPGSQAWMALNLSPAAYMAYTSALTHPVRSDVPGTPGWLVRHMSASSFASLVHSYNKKEGTVLTNLESELEKFYEFLKAEYSKFI